MLFVLLMVTIDAKDSSIEYIDSYREERWELWPRAPIVYGAIDVIGGSYRYSYCFCH